MIFRFLIAFSTIIFFPYSYLLAQPYGSWIPVQSEDAIAMPGEFIYSANLDLLVYTGAFIRDDNSKYIAGFNGIGWELIADNVGGVRSCIDYQDGLLLAGNAECGIGSTLPYIAFFDGDLTYCPWDFDGPISDFKWVNDTLTALGTFSEINGEPAFRVARLIDGIWEGLLDPSQDFGSPLFKDIEWYNDQLYIGGNINSVDWPQDLAIIENGLLIPVGPGLTGAWTVVNNLVVYNDELYISGGIPYSQGNIGNHILRWDGAELKTVGPLFRDQQGGYSTSGGVFDLFQMDGYLYAGGSFYFIGEEDISIFARWDGFQWCGMGADDFGDFTYRCNYFDNQIVRFVGNALLENGDYNPVWRLADLDDNGVCTDVLSSIIEGTIAEISIYPNPVFQSSGSEVSITSYVKFSEISVFDLAGRLVLQKRIKPSYQYSLSLNGMQKPQGLYVVHLVGHGHQSAQKLIIFE